MVRSIDRMDRGTNAPKIRPERGTGPDFIQLAPLKFWGLAR